MKKIMLLFLMGIILIGFLHAAAPIGTVKINEEWTHSHADEERMYEIKNLKFYVPKGGVVDYNFDGEKQLKDNQIIVTIPERSIIIEPPSKIDTTKSAGVEIKYVVEKSEKGLKIENVGVIKGYPVDNKYQKLELFFDTEKGNFYLKNYFNFENHLVGFLGKQEDRKIYLYTDGGQHLDSNDAYISFNKQTKKISFGVPKGNEGIFVNFLEGNEIVNPQSNGFFYARAIGKNDKSHITITNRENENKIAKVDTLGSYYILSGDSAVYYQQSNELHGRTAPKTGKNRQFDGKSSIPVLISSRDVDGRSILFDLKVRDEKTGEITEERKIFDKNIFMNENGYVYTKKTEESEFYDRIEVARLGIIEIDRLSKLASLSEEKQKQLLEGKTVKQLLEGNAASITDAVGKIPLTNIISGTTPSTTTTTKTPTTPTNPKTPTIPTTTKTPTTTTSFVGWEKNNKIGGYTPLKDKDGKEIGYFYADVGKFKDGTKEEKVPYVTLERLSTISKGKTISVVITEPGSAHCTNCIKEILDNKSKKIIYLTKSQAEKIGWKTTSDDYVIIKVKDGKIIK